MRFNNNNNLKICFPLVECGSGSDVWTYNIAKSLSEKGLKVEIRKYPHFYQYVPWLIKRNFKTDADIIHTNSWNGFAFKQINKPLVVTEHLVVHNKNLDKYKSLPQKTFHKFLVRNFEKSSFDCADAITAVSHYAAREVDNIFQKKCVPIHNGVSTDVFYRKKVNSELVPNVSDKIKLLYVGNQTERKGFDLLEKIIEKLDDRFILLTTAGLRTKARKRVSPKIVPIGKLSQKQLNEFYNYCDIFLFPSRMEGFGLTAVEAMLCAKPVVTHNISSLPEIVPQRELLCDLDCVDSFVEKIEKLSLNSEFRDKIGRQNFNFASENFLIDNMTERYVELYHDVLKRFY